ncbi:MAG: CNNM domain-containing protein [Simkaniaceae bacterium]|nr:CNNM domain-containing protein [Simkaniaceae bacterium]
MREGPYLFLLLLLIALIVQGFYSMLEMACMSFNRVRLQYYVSRGSLRAAWTSKLLAQPAAFFGTTLIGVNAAMQFGSECARRFFASLGLSPDWATLSQVILVLLIAELPPMFVARRYAESVTMIGIPVVYVTSAILRPVTLVLERISLCVNTLFHVKSSTPPLSREELKRAIEERDDKGAQQEGRGAGFDPVLSDLFSLERRRAKDFMKPIESARLIRADATVGDLRTLLGFEPSPFAFLFEKTKNTIAGVVFIRHLLGMQEDTPVIRVARPPWFVGEGKPLFRLIEAFRGGNQGPAIVLNRVGFAVGFLPFKAVLETLLDVGRGEMEERRVIVDRCLPETTLVSEVNARFGLSLPEKGGESLEELMARTIGRKPGKGDSCRFGRMKLTVEGGLRITGGTISIRSVD